jgi:ABC-type branched-subunit amino acid transport system ATPase component/ABC-type branched-subunit amino acid transport system permease subunit
MLVYLGTDLLAAWGLNLEFGVAGVANFAYIVLVAAGAYFYAALTLGSPAALGNFQSYIIGARLPVLAAIVIAALMSGLLGCLIGVTGLKRLRADYQAMVMLVISILATTVVGADTGLFNGDAGLSLIPNPLASISAATRGWYYVGIVAVACVLGYLALRRFTTGPVGRVLRAVREDEDAAIAIGKNVVRLRLGVQAVGGVYAGLSGALLAGFIGGWSPQSWQYVETLALLTAIIVGGLGNDAGVLLGTIIVPVLILQGVQFLPQVQGAPELTADLGWIVLGLLTIAFVYTRPRGLIPERRPHYGGERSGLLSRWLARRAAARPVTGLPEQPASPASQSATVPGNGAAAERTTLLADVAASISAPSQAAALAANGRAAPLLSASGLVKAYGGLHAVDGATFTVDAGQITGLIGPNGAGKSTVLGIVSGFLRADAGELTFDGDDVGGISAYQRARRGIVRTFQLPREFRGLTTLENLVVAVPSQRGESALGVTLGARWWRAEERSLVERGSRLLELFGMADKRDERAGQLSGGQKRMLEVMRALMVGPRLLLLDEPMAGLAPALADRLETACRELADRGLSILLVEHELRAVERLCERVIVMAQGKVISEGSMSELRTRKEVQDAYVVG